VWRIRVILSESEQTQAWFGDIWNKQLPHANATEWKLMIHTLFQVPCVSGNSNIAKHAELNGFSTRKATCEPRNADCMLVAACIALDI
jgi:hypothetical protein